jgi:hypothetical protein
LENAAISVNVYQPGPAGATREEASRLLLECIEETAWKVRHVPEAEIEEAIDKAAEYVRHHRE